MGDQVIIISLRPIEIIEYEKKNIKKIIFAIFNAETSFIWPTLLIIPVAALICSLIKGKGEK